MTIQRVWAKEPRHPKPKERKSAACCLYPTTGRGLDAQLINRETQIGFSKVLGMFLSLRSRSLIKWFGTEVIYPPEAWHASGQSLLADVDSPHQVRLMEVS